MKSQQGQCLLGTASSMRWSVDQRAATVATADVNARVTLARKWPSFPYLSGVGVATSIHEFQRTGE